MKRRTIFAGVLALVALATVTAQAGPPVYEARVLPLPDDVVGLMDGASEGIYQETGVRILPPSECAPENAFEMGIGGRYGDACRRLSIVFGPIQARPGQDDVLIQPVTFEKPFYPGYITRFKPDLVGADGVSPRVKDVHLHHGTWFNGVLGADPGGRSYGWGPWIASGEEKTIASWPTGFGLKVEPTDKWTFLHMVHNATAQTFPVWVRYDLDFVDATWAEQTNAETGLKNIENTKGIWLDVGDCSMRDSQGKAPGCEKDSFNPVFNIHRGMGSIEPGACIFPRENCGQFNTFGTGKLSAQQGKPVPGGAFDDWTIPQDGTLVVMGGHLHSGGLRDDVYLVRNFGTEQSPDWQSRLIHKSDAYYWDHQRPDEFDPFEITKNIVGGPPVSWDMVMTGVTRDLGWSINVKKGDKLRLEGVYDNRIGTWYEQMGIVMSWMAPKDDDTPWLGLDPFAPGVEIDEGVLEHPDVVQPPTVPGYELPGSDFGDGVCTPGATTICVRGSATHTRNETSADHDTCGNTCQKIAELAPDGPLMTNIPIGGFSYGPAELGVVSAFGVPTVKVNEPLTFWNFDTADDMWHTITRCKLPCSGETQASYPLADGAWDDTYDPETRLYTNPLTGLTAAHPADLGPDPMDFDSGIIGLGTGANNKFNDANRSNPAVWTWKPTRTGTFTFWCRIHPSMRGAIRVVD